MRRIQNCVYLNMLFKAVFVVVLLSVALVDCGSPKRKLGGGSRRLGGWKKIDPSSDNVQAVALKATKHLESAHNSIKAYKLQQVLAAKSQVVAGINYQLTLKIGQTECNRGPSVDLNKCAVTKVQKCAVTVWERAWLNSTQVTNFTCGKEKKVPQAPKTARPPISGGESNINPSNEDARKAASFAATELTSRANGAYTVQHLQIIRGTQQVVSGMMYRLTIQVSVTQAGKFKGRNTRCTVKVWDQAWRNPRYVLEEYKCDGLIA